ncbi:glycosyl hydrolase family 88 [Enterocloster clostridioformis]|uniref:glycoside hydrolase family 88 protein n=1 Tax=Enterocloster clostridioformis TaxID=1531 RepID=UPI00080C6A6A|nr:glycoside hydrolase family 88 protein [Enterocloster clostridioformis]ANU44791.1 glycosyl hydrolase family 88 [Lachnoclostridium sp. YL32]NDO27841.1 glycosyl hydrolase family 88 [Enterocloster clostridioformis]OXE70302.1 glycosyl hydrolase family 88 [Enterocloster clostridioformis]QQR00446.1 glycoside hydrolase family 88 protein [Enterocloster clostridioformis]
MEQRVLKSTDQEWLDQTYEKLLAKMKAECARVGTNIPYIPGEDGKYHDITETKWGRTQDGGLTLSNWTNGFWPGMLWQMYHATGDEAYMAAAVGVEERLEEVLNDPESVGHDLGFMFLQSAVANYRETGSAEARRRGLLAASELAARYNLDGRFIRAWPGPRHSAITDMLGGGDVRGWTIIDCMMNLPLLYWASEELDDPRFYKIAVNHAKTAQQYIIRPDGSCNHIVAFDPDTGEYLNNPGGQGYESGSSWSRGQSWAVYGFALSYRHTGDQSFLDTAKKCAHYCIANLSVNDWLPLVDYRAPLEPVKYDSTAAMITACGLLEIAEHIGEHEKSLYIEAACRILRACDAKFANWDPEQDSIMSKGTFFYHDPDGTNTEVPIIYADYYLIEAVLRMKGKDLFQW